MIKVTELSKFDETMKKFGFQLPTDLAIMPSNIQSVDKKAELLNAETTSTVRVLLRQAGVPMTPLSDDKIPEIALIL